MGNVGSAGPSDCLSATANTLQLGGCVVRWGTAHWAGVATPLHPDVTTAGHKLPTTLSSTASGRWYLPPLQHNNVGAFD